MQPSLIVTDLDGTLWHHDTTLDQTTRHALVRLNDFGIPVLAATARTLPSNRTKYAELNIVLPTVTGNGALGCDVDGTVFHSQPLGAEVAVAVVDAFFAVGVSPQMSVDNGGINDVYSADARTVSSYAAHASRYITLIDDLRKAAASVPVYQIWSIGIALNSANGITEKLAHIPGALSFQTKELQYLEGGTERNRPMSFRSRHGLTSEDKYRRH